jgi:large subunit ribosomal protein L18
MQNREISRKKRHRRIRKKIFGTKDRPRCVIKKSLNHIYIQLVDDENGKVLVGLSSLSPKIKDKIKSVTVKTCKEIGKIFAQKSKESKINSIVFDRGGYIYHGKIKALAESLREEGLKF